MTHAVLFAAAAVLLTARASAADSVVELTLDGRPVDRHGDVAILHKGVVFADAIALTRSFNGLITLRRSGAATITIGANTGTFTPGSRQATVNTDSIALPAAPLRRNGDLFVPLAAFSRHIAAARVRFDAVLARADIRVNTHINR